MIAIIGFLMTVTLLFLMTNLIAEPEQVKKIVKEKEEEFVVIKEVKEPECRCNKKKIPQIPIEPSKDINLDIEVEPLEIESLMMTEFSPVTSSIVGELLEMKELHSGFEDYDREAVPLMQTTPAYPIIALQKGIEGWVKLQFDVDSAGFANNIKVVAASHKRIFDKAAKKALKQWKFKPGKRNGADIGLDNQKVTMEFNLEQH